MLDPFMNAAIIRLAMNISKVAEESGLKQLNQDGITVPDSTENLTQQSRDLLLPIAQKYMENYTNRHGTFKVLGMGKPVSIEAVYTQVNFHPAAIQDRESIAAEEQAFRQRGSKR